MTFENVKPYALHFVRRHVVPELTATLNRYTFVEFHISSGSNLFANRPRNWFFSAKVFARNLPHRSMRVCTIFNHRTQHIRVYLFETIFLFSGFDFKTRRFYCKTLTSLTRSVYVDLFKQFQWNAHETSAVPFCKRVSLLTIRFYNGFFSLHPSSISERCITTTSFPISIHCTKVYLTLFFYFAL